MTKDEARELLDWIHSNEEPKDPGGGMLALRQTFERANPQERAALNEVIREWLVSRNETDRFDAAYMTSEFRIVRNLDLVMQLRAKAEHDVGPQAPHDRMKYDRLIAELGAATPPDFSAVDPILNAWAMQHGLHVSTKCNDEDVRFIPVVDAAGREFQIWLDPDGGGGYKVQAASVDRRRRLWHGWSSESAFPSRVETMLDAALLEIRKWTATLEGKSYQEAGLV